MSKLAKIFGGAPQLPALPKPEPVPTVADPSIKRKRDEQSRAAKLRSGRTSTRRADQSKLGTATVRRAGLLGQTGDL